MQPGPEKADEVYAIVNTIPFGCVATYGQVADNVTTMRVSAREVGSIMSFCPEGVPWHRVVGAGGKLPIAKKSPHLAIEQRRLLSEENVQFRKNELIDMPRHQWTTDNDVMSDGAESH